MESFPMLRKVGMDTHTHHEHQAIYYSSEISKHRSLCAEAQGWTPDGEDSTAGTLPPQCSAYQQKRGMGSMQPLGQEEDLAGKEEPAGLTLCSL